MMVSLGPTIRFTGDNKQPPKKPAASPRLFQRPFANHISDTFSLDPAAHQPAAPRFELIKAQDQYQYQNFETRDIKQEVRQHRHIEDLQARHQAGDPQVSQIAMNDGKRVEIRPGEAHHLWTTNLNGCLATLIITRLKNGKKHLTLTHYPPTALEQNIQKLKDLLGNNPELRERGARHTIVLANPGQHGNNYELQPCFPDVTQALEQAIRALLNPQAEIEVRSPVYSMDIMGIDRKTMVVDADKAVSYELSNEEGEMIDRYTSD